MLRLYRGIPGIRGFMLDNFVTILLFIFVFCILVVTHEFGHYILAKINGVRVIEFGIGMGPKIAGFHKNGTDYCIRLFPFGGACIYDLTDDETAYESVAGSKGVKGEKISDKAGSDSGFLHEKQGIPYGEASLFSRISIVLAGPIFNFIMAYFLALIVVWNTGTALPEITGVMEDYPAAEAGIQAGDVITKMNGSNVYLASEIYINTYLNKERDMTIEFLRDGERKEVTLTPKYNEEAGRYLVGFNGYGKYITTKNIRVFKYAYYEVRYSFVGTGKSLLMLLQGRGSKDDVAGPVGIAQTIGEVKDAAAPYGVWMVMLNMLNIAMLFSVNIGILNLLPLPAIDGGKFLFLVVEGIRGKKIPPEKEGIVHLVGFALLMVLMIFVMYNDIMRIIAG